MNSEDLKMRTKKFARRCLKLCIAIPKDFNGSYISGQLMRCSLSTAANYRAACLAQSRKHFASKISIVLEEADEAMFWLEIIGDENLLPSFQLTELYNEAYELTRIFLASRATSQNKPKSAVKKQ